MFNFKNLLTKHIKDPLTVATVASGALLLYNKLNNSDDFTISADPLILSSGRIWKIVSPQGKQSFIIGTASAQQSTENSANNIEATQLENKLLENLVITAELKRIIDNNKLFLFTSTPEVESGKKDLLFSTIKKRVHIDPTAKIKNIGNLENNSEGKKTSYNSAQICWIATNSVVLFISIATVSTYPVTAIILPWVIPVGAAYINNNSGIKKEKQSLEIENLIYKYFCSPNYLVCLNYFIYDGNKPSENDVTIVNNAFKKFIAETRTNELVLLMPIQHIHQQHLLGKLTKLNFKVYRVFETPNFKAYDDWFLYVSNEFKEQSIKPIVNDLLLDILKNLNNNCFRVNAPPGFNCRWVLKKLARLYSDSEQSIKNSKPKISKG